MYGFLNQLIALIIFILALPIILFTAFLILIFERKWPFFIQERLGINKVPFILYKIRSMHQNKVTFIGRVTRRTGIDELPQLINIMKGDILFVGPRPLAQTDIERLEWTSNYYSFRWAIKPGLTGLAQLSPLCNKKVSIFWDKYYTINKTIWLDLKIILTTFFMLFLGKNRVKKLIILKK
ncbi:MAG: sugar transferase [Crocinitomicaceae bacterium]